MDWPAALVAIAAISGFTAIVVVFFWTPPR